MKSNKELINIESQIERIEERGLLKLFCEHIESMHPKSLYELLEESRRGDLEIRQIAIDILLEEIDAFKDLEGDLY